MEIIIPKGKLSKLDRITICKFLMDEILEVEFVSQYDCITELETLSMIISTIKGAEKNG